MKLSIDFGRWTPTKAAVAVAGALAIGGAIGSAVAIGPTVPAPVKWQGGWEANNVGASGVPNTIFTVPAGRNLLITDIIVSGDDALPGEFGLFTASGTCASLAAHRLRSVAIPANDTVVIPLTTGIGFASGQTICIRGFDGGSIDVNMRGFLFTAAPVS